MSGDGGGGGRPAPQNIEAEKGLLGIIMERNDALFDVTHLIGKADFYEPHHGELFTLMRDQIEQGKAATPTTLLHDTSQDADIGGILTSGYLATLLREAPPSSVVRDLARTVHDLAIRRKLIQVSQKVMDEAYSAPASITGVEIETRYHADASTLFSSLTEIGVRSFAEVGDQLLNRVADAARRETPLGIDLGLKALQELTGALLPGRLYTLAAAAGAGKTGLALQLAVTIARTDPVLFFSIEMDPEELATRHLSALSGVGGEKIERATINADDWGLLQDALKASKGLKLYLDGSTSPTVGAIRGKVIRMKRKTGVAVVIIDHMLYIARDPKLGEFDAARQNLQALKKMAKDLGVAVILLAHLKQSYMTLDKLRDPHDGDVYGGGAVPQESDVLVILHREEMMLGKRKPAPEDTKQVQDWEQKLLRATGKAKFILGKRRAGHSNGARTVGFEETSQHFSDTIPKSAIETLPTVGQQLGLETEDAPF